MGGAGTTHRLQMGTSGESLITATTTAITNAGGATAVGAAAWGATLTMGFVRCLRTNTMFDSSLVQLAYGSSSCTQISKTGVAHNITFTCVSGQLIATANAVGEEYTINVIEIKPG